MTNLNEVKSILADRIAADLKVAAKEMTLEEWGVSVEMALVPSDYREAAAFLAELKAAAGVRHDDELLEVTRAAMAELHAEYQAPAPEEATLAELGDNLAEGIKKAILADARMLGVECAVECW